MIRSSPAFRKVSALYSQQLAGITSTRTITNLNQPLGVPCTSCIQSFSVSTCTKKNPNLGLRFKTNGFGQFYEFSPIVCRYGEETGRDLQHIETAITRGVRAMPLYDSCYYETHPISLHVSRYFTIVALSPADVEMTRSMKPPVET